MKNRKWILTQAEKCVNGDRNHRYSEPEDAFEGIADLWSAYLHREITAIDVANMMILLKIARTMGGEGNIDNFVDIAGYAACGGEIWDNYDMIGKDQNDVDVDDPDYGVGVFS